MLDIEYLKSKDLSELKDIAREIGLEFPKNIGKTKLLEKIIADEAEVEGKPKATEVEGFKVRKKETPSEIKKRMNKLVRCRISANDPQYKERSFVSMQVGNSTAVVGKHIPFDTIWHVQEIILDRLKKRTYRQTKFKTDRLTGNKIPVTTIKPSFAIEILPQLSEKELEKLAAEQAARGSIDTGED